MPRDHVGDDQRRDHRHHERRGRGENAEPGVGEEEKQQRPEVEYELEHRIELRLLCRFHADVLTPQGDGESSPAMAREKSRAENGARSSTLSPTPMKCTGSLNFSASATRIPPRAVPSSLVMTRPVTPAIFWKISTCDSAFCPTVASSTSSTACGTEASTFFITRSTFSSSFISSRRFCKRPAVSTSSTSTPSAFAAATASNTRPAASAPASRAMNLAPVRPAQILS